MRREKKIKAGLSNEKKKKEESGNPHHCCSTAFCQWPLRCFFGKDRGQKTLSQSLMDMCTLLYLQWITNKDLLCSTQNPPQCYMVVWL